MTAAQLQPPVGPRAPTSGSSGPQDDTEASQLGLICRPTASYSDPPASFRQPRPKEGIA
jgi:hypothetical protein